SGDNRVLGASLVSNPTVFALELRDSDMLVRTIDLGAFSHALPRLARDAGVSLLEVRPTDESLESVFSYLVTR
ncbi:MAG: ABC transporter ATP-binding protein, partial [Dehalococcoidia bacterium]